MRTIDNRYKYADEHGSYSVCFGERTIGMKFVSFLNEPRLDKFCADLGMMQRVIESQY